ncbi:MAG: hypothetical protein ACTHJP_04905 [Rhodanobacteraceae bacterium]
MPDVAMEPLPRIALVFGDEAAVSHVREAVTGHVDVVYAAPAGEFDVARCAGATAALVNLDGGDWLEPVETNLDAAGIAVVYNDPEISQSLEGWARARWLRHLVAKLRGSRDVDPPRPDTLAQATPEPPAMPEPAAPIAENVPTVAAGGGGPARTAVVELPLSPEEIENMAADFVAGQESAPAPLVEAAADAGILSSKVSEQPPAALSPDTPIEFEAPLETPAMQAAPAEYDFEAEAALDVDTEALSAMIDARLAAPQSAESSPEVWREVSGGALPSRQSDDVPEIEAAPAEKSAPAPVAEAVNDDVDVLASLPSLDDWALVDHDAVPAAAVNRGAQKSPEPVLPDAFAGLELVPMETVAPLRVDADPIERWFGGEVGRKAAVNDSGSKVKEASHEHG